MRLRLRRELRGTRHVISGLRAMQVSHASFIQHRWRARIPHGAHLREDTPVTLDDMVGPYRSKFLAEQVALQSFGRRSSRRYVNPSTFRRTARLQAHADRQDVVDCSKIAGCRLIWTRAESVVVDDCARGHCLPRQKHSRPRITSRLRESYTLADGSSSSAICRSSSKVRIRVFGRIWVCALVRGLRRAL